MTVACYKGGVAKTTTVASLAGILAADNKKVLMVDLDGQRNLTRSFSSHEFPETIIDSLRTKGLKGRGDLPIYNIKENLDLVPADSELVNFDTEFVNVIAREIILKKLITRIKDNYDWILIDTPAQLGQITINAIVASDYILVPMVSDKFSIDAVEDFISFNDAIKEGLDSYAKIIGIVMTKYRERRLADRLMRDELNTRYDELLCQSCIRENSAIVRAPFFLQDVTAYDRKSNGAIDYAALLTELKNRVGDD